MTYNYMPTFGDIIKKEKRQQKKPIKPYEIIGLMGG